MQVVTATASMYGCNSTISWNPIAYIPVVNAQSAVQLVKEVANSMAAIKRFEEVDRPFFVAEDVAFFNSKHSSQTHACSLLSAQHTDRSSFVTALTQRSWWPLSLLL